MPGLSHPIRSIPNQSQLTYFPWQRYLEMRKVTHMVNQIVTVLVQDFPWLKLLSALAEKPLASKQVIVDFDHVMDPYVLDDSDANALSKRLGVGAAAGATWGKWLAFFKQEQWNPYFQVKQESAHHSSDSRHTKIKAYDQKLHEKLLQLDEQLGKDRIDFKSKSGWTLWLAKKRLTYIRNLYFDALPVEKAGEPDILSNNASMQDKMKASLEKMKNQQSMQFSRKMVLFMTIMFAIMAVGTLAIIAGSGVLGASLAAFVGHGGIKIILAPSVWLASHALPSMSSWLFIPVASSFIANALVWIHSSLYAETTWRLWPFHKPHFSYDRIQNLNSAYHAFIDQIKHLNFLRLPGEEFRANDSFVTLATWKIVLKTCVNPLRLGYSVLSLVHGVLNIICDLLAHFVGMLFDFVSHYRLSVSNELADLLKLPIDFVFTLAYLSAEIIIKATDVVWNLVLPTLGKVFIGLPLTAKLAWDQRNSQSPAPNNSSTATIVAVTGGTQISKTSPPEVAASSTQYSTDHPGSGTSSVPIPSVVDESATSLLNESDSDKEQEVGLTSV